MARVAKVTVTLAEQAALEYAIDVLGISTAEQVVRKNLRSLLGKATAARADAEVAEPGYPVKRFLEILGRSRKVAVPRSAPDGYYVKLYRAIEGHELTDARVETLVAWLDRQTWMRGAVSPDTVVAKLADWLARAEKDGAGSTAASGAPPELED